MMSPRMQIVWEVLEMAKDNQDAMVIAACRRAIVANRLGRTKTDENRADIALICQFHPRA